MKTASLTYPSPFFIDTAPLAARYAVLAQAILAMVIAGRFRESMRLAHKVARLVRALTRCEAHNHHLTRKLDMLVNKPWREQVLKELGGLRKLKLWEAAKARIEARAAETPITLKDETPAWLLTPERIAESERLKTHARMCGRATAHPLIFRDRVKMDFEGEFRLAPLPRGERAKPQMKVYTEKSIVDYDWNNVPFGKDKGFGPASVWPIEFYAAMGMEAQSALSFVIPAQTRSDAEPGPNPEDSVLRLGPASAPLRGSCGMTGQRNHIPLLPLSDVLSPKVRRDLLGSLTS